MRKENTFNQDLDENLICRSLDACLRKRGMTGGKCIRKRGMTNKKGCQLGGMTLLFCLLSGVAHAECVPAPDCASIGYTETSCSGDSLKCPFDTSKLFCVPCDSSYKYDCSGDNITGGVGSSCGGKYISCSCSGNATFDNGNCIETCSNTACTVGAIYYSDGTCCSNVLSVKTAIGVVVKDNALVMSQRSSSKMAWSTVHVDTSLYNYEDSTDAKEDFNGKSNTVTIMTDDTNNVAAKYCNDYTTAGTNAGDWYLPAAGELYSYVYGNYTTIKTAMTSIGWTWSDNYLWSSSEYSRDHAWHVYPPQGLMANYEVYKYSDFNHVSCFLAIN